MAKFVSKDELRGYDFAGWATRNDVLCSDGRTIKRDAFKECDGTTVPIVWQHKHDSVSNVLGHALLFNKPEGVWCYGKFNDSKQGNDAKESVRNGDISSLSIFANRLKQNGGDVLHGTIREVSLVLAGANPKAYIEFTSLTHGDAEEEEANIYFDSPLYEVDDELLSHEEMCEESEPVVEFGDLYYEEQAAMAHKEDNMYNNEYSGVDTEYEYLAHSEDATVEEVLNSMTENQLAVLQYLVGQALAAGNESKEGEETMKHNAFDYQEVAPAMNFNELVSEAKTIYGGSLKEAVLAHADAFGIDPATRNSANTMTGVNYGYGRGVEGNAYGYNNLDYLFPDAHALNTEPKFVDNPTEWVSAVLNGSTHTPYARVKSTWADISGDEMRAKGYVRGSLKVPEVAAILKRSTEPQTIYKTQKIDRDDVIDITDFSVVAWQKKVLRRKLDEELARAALIGDGRQFGTDPDAIDPSKIRPIVSDSPLFVIRQRWTPADGATDSDNAAEFIRQCVKGFKYYQGAGKPTCFIKEDLLCELLLLEDMNGHRIYKSEAELATAMRVARIVTVRPLDGVQEVVASGADQGTWDVDAIILNMKDYTFGSDKGGNVEMFDDFDIDYNQYKYLIETRCSGAMTTPYGAILVERKHA